MEEPIKQLEEPLDHTRVKIFGDNVGAKKGLSYLEGHDVIRELNTVFGFRWNHEVKELKLIDCRSYTTRNGKEMVQPYYTCTVEISVSVIGSDRLPFYISHDGVGGGSASMPEGNIAEAYEFAAKEAETDAIKRAAMKFGDRFGLALYDKTQENVTKPYNAASFAMDIFQAIQKTHKLDQPAAAKHIQAAITHIAGEARQFKDLTEKDARKVADHALETKPE